MASMSFAVSSPQALAVNPDEGTPLNQLAILGTSDGDGVRNSFTAAHFYFRRSAIPRGT